MHHVCKESQRRRSRLGKAVTAAAPAFYYEEQRNMGDRRQPSSPPANQRKPDPPPAPPRKRFDGVFVICAHGHRHGSIVAAAACDTDD